MNTRTIFTTSSRAGRRARLAGFTLAEMMVASAVFLFVVAGIMAAHLFGLRMFQIAQTKLVASDSMRKAVSRMSDEIKCCKSTYVGNVSNGTFVAVINGVPQAGGGLLIYPTTNTNSFIIYFVNHSDQTLRRTTSATNSTTILAESVTNTAVFSAQDFKGRVLTNSQRNQLIQFSAQFYQPQRFGVVPDYYNIETALTPRSQ
jgi:hypothetical protein